MHHDGDRDTHGRRFHLKIRHVILAVFATLLVVGIFHTVVLGIRANRRLEALRAAGQPTSLAELALRNKLPMGMDNAASLYESAFAAHVRPASDSNVPYLGRGKESPDRSAAFPEPVAKAIAECLAANEECLSLLHQAAAVGECRYEHDPRQGFTLTKEWRGCALLLKLAIVQHAHQGETDSVVACAHDALRLGESLRKEPGLMFFLMRTSCTSVAITGLERALSVATFTDSQLRDLDDALAAAARAIDLAEVMAGERCCLLDTLKDPSRMGPAGPGGTIFKLPGVRARGILDILDYTEDSIAAAGLPREQQAARFREIEERVRGLSIRHLAAQILISGLRVGEFGLGSMARTDLARTALAIERFRLATGKIPEQLADLVPKYLPEVPIDPFDGRPIRYRRTEPGYLLYSVREDGQDNGGKESHQVARGQPFDLCFIVAR